MNPDVTPGQVVRELHKRRSTHVHRPVRVRDEDDNVVGGFCPCGLIVNRKMRPAWSASRRRKVVEQMERIRDQEEEQDAQEQEE